MRIVLQSGQEYVLAHGPERVVGQHRGPSGIAHDNDISTQVDRLLRASRARATKRDNELTEYSFQVVVEFADLNAAAVYATTYPKIVPRSGSLVVQQTVAGQTATATMASAVLRKLSIRQDGVSVVIRYFFTGGGFD